MPSPPTRLLQSTLGGATMLFWLGITVVTLTYHPKFDDVPLALRFAFAAAGFYFWMFTWKINGTMIGSLLFDQVPDPWNSIFSIAMVVTMASSWVAILLQPALFDWRHRPWMVLAIQNTFALAQLIGTLLATEAI